MPPTDGWTGLPERLPDGFRMNMAEGHRKHVAVCEAWTNPGGWELRILKDGQSLIATVVPSADEMRALMEKWRTAFLETGWR